MRGTGALIAGLVVFSGGVASGQDSQAACERLKGFHESSSQVLAAEYAPAGAIPVPRMGPSSPASIVLNAHCILRTKTSTSSDSAVTTELWLPDAASWNGKMLATGNGGYSSAISLSQMAEGLRNGYAVAGSDTGHQGDGLDFGAGHPEKIKDWAFRSTHVMAEIERQAVAAYYGKPPQHSYFTGCSTGGQQALSEAQRYPRDFDGIVAGDPGNDRILLNADFVESWLTTHPSGSAAFPPGKLPLLNKAAVTACDKQDGVPDGVISEPDKCQFDPGVLACGSGIDSLTCLTDAEIAMVRRLYDGPVRDSAGKPIYPGWTRGSEAGWGPYLIAPAKPVRVEFWSSWVFESSLSDKNQFSVRAFDAPASIAQARAKLPWVEAMNPDLRAFQENAGKLLMYHGWADPVVPPGDTVAYYRQVEKILGASTGKSVRLFMVPGMGHCGGGLGASTFDALQALDLWVTKGDAPESILASHVEDGKASMTRPLCAFPKVAHWDGVNNVSAASSYRCVDSR